MIKNWLKHNFIGPSQKTFLKEFKDQLGEMKPLLKPSFPEMQCLIRHFNNWLGGRGFPYKNDEGAHHTFVSEKYLDWYCFQCVNLK